MAIIKVRCKASLRYEDLEDQLVVQPVSDVPKNPRNAYLCFFVALRGNKVPTSLGIQTWHANMSSKCSKMALIHQFAKLRLT